MKKYDHVWTYACIDFSATVTPDTVEKQLEECGLVAQMCRDAGCDIMEVGCPMIYSFGHRATAYLRDVLGPGYPLAVDYKAQDHVYTHFLEAHRFGADYATVCCYNNEGGFKEALRAKEDTGIKVIADLFATPAEQLPALARHCEDSGADIVLLHFGAEENMYGCWPGRRDSDYVREVAPVLNRCPLWVVSNEPEDVERSIKDGADGILFGFALADNSLESYKKTKAFVDMTAELSKKYYKPQTL